jgi:integrase
LEQMRWSDVDLDASQLVIQPRRSHSRTVHFGAQTLLALEALRQRRPESELVLGNTPIRLLHRMSRQLGTLSAQIGMRRVTFQELRQVFCMRLVNAGAPAVVIMAITDCALSTLVRYLAAGGDQELRSGYEAGPNQAN